MEKTYVFALPLSSVLVISDLLAEAPWKRANAVITAMQAQITAQDAEAAKAAKADEPTASGGAEIAAG